MVFPLHVVKTLAPSLLCLWNSNREIKQDRNALWELAGAPRARQEETESLLLLTIYEVNFL